MRVRALMTVEIGTPVKPITVPRGGTFDIDDSDPEGLVARGIAEPTKETAEGFVEGPTDADKAAAAKAAAKKAEDDKAALAAIKPVTPR